MCIKTRTNSNVQDAATIEATKTKPRKEWPVNNMWNPPEGEWVSPFAKWTEEDWKTRQFPTLAELRAVVPEHCFERNHWTGAYYICRDIFSLALAVGFFRWCGLNSQLPESVWSYPGWAAAWWFYAMLVGGVSGGLWTMGHECGHHAFSESDTVSDCVGWVIHSLFFMPYFSWQFSHGKHHRRCNDLIDGETHVPQHIDDTHAQFQIKIVEYFGHTVMAAYGMLSHFFFCPMYFLFNLSGGRFDAEGEPIGWGPALIDHFNPFSRLFPKKWRGRVVLSDVGLLLVMAGCYYFAQIYGWRAVMLWYVSPVAAMNNVWLVAYTWMQHTHASIPHFGTSDWTFIKGAIVGTVDRPCQVADFFAHNIQSTHICHHLFPKLPCYHAKEATEHLRDFLDAKDMYNFDPINNWKAMWIASKTCHYMEGLEGVQFYKSFKQLIAERKKAD